jgi:hypothetical protein
MTYDEIKTALAEIVPMMAEKGLRLPEAGASINADGTSWVIISHAKTPSSFYADERKYFTIETTIPAAIAEARAWVEALPTPENKAMTDYMGLLATAIDFGHENNIPAEYVDPVRITQKAMTENLLTKGGDE